jgi:urease accessory protein
VPLELQPDHLKIEPDHVLADMLRAMHLIVTEDQAPSSPKAAPMRPAGTAMGTGHGHGHDHDHAHDAGHGHTRWPAAPAGAAAAPHVHGPLPSDHGHDGGHAATTATESAPPASCPASPARWRCRQRCCS